MSLSEIFQKAREANLGVKDAPKPKPKPSLASKFETNEGLKKQLNEAAQIVKKRNDAEAKATREKILRDRKNTYEITSPSGAKYKFIWPGPGEMSEEWMERKRQQAYKMEADRIASLPQRKAKAEAELAALQAQPAVRNLSPLQLAADIIGTGEVPRSPEDNARMARDRLEAGREMARRATEWDTKNPVGRAIRGALSAIVNQASIGPALNRLLTGRDLQVPGVGELVSGAVKPYVDTAALLRDRNTFNQLSNEEKLGLALEWGLPVAAIGAEKALTSAGRAIQKAATKKAGTSVAEDEFINLIRQADKKPGGVKVDGIDISPELVESVKNASKEKLEEVIRAYGPRAKDDPEVKAHVKFLQEELGRRKPAKTWSGGQSSERVKAGNTLTDAERHNMHSTANKALEEDIEAARKRLATLKEGSKGWKRQKEALDILEKQKAQRDARFAGATPPDKVEAQLRESIRLLEKQKLSQKLESVAESFRPGPRRLPRNKRDGYLEIGTPIYHSIVTAAKGMRSAEEFFEKLKQAGVVDFAGYDKAWKDATGEVVTFTSKGVIREGAKAATAAPKQTGEGEIPRSKLVEGTRGVTDVIRASKLGSDFGVALRQGMYGLVNDPVSWAKSMKKAVGALGDEGYEMALKSIRERPGAKVGREAGLSLVDSLDTKEEAFASKLLSKVPGMKQLERGQTVFINNLRADMFDKFAKHAKNQAELKEYASWVNTMTGRGNVKEVPEILEIVMTSPRYTKSRWEFFTEIVKSPATLARAAKDKAARQKIKDLARSAGAIYTILKVAEARGAKVNFDPESSDFLKIRIGEKVYDPTAGISFPLRTVLRIATTTNKYRKGESVPGYLTPGSQIEKVLTNSLSPGITVPYQMVASRSVGGYELEESEKGLAGLAPLIVTGFNETYKKEGLAAALADLPVEFFGINVNRYPAKKESNKPKKPLKKKKKTGIN